MREEQGSVTIEGDVWRRLVDVVGHINTDETRQLLRDLERISAAIGMLPKNSEFESV
jgi:hypothetical protein